MNNTLLITDAPPPDGPPNSPATVRTTSLRFGTWDSETALAERRMLAIEREADLAPLVGLTARERQARLGLALRSSVLGDASYVRALFAEAERRTQKQRRARSGLRPRSRTPGRSGGRVRAASPGSSDDADPPGDDDEPAKSKDEQTVIVCRARNAKLAGPGQEVWATTAPVALTCLRSCPFLDNGCYAQRGPGGHNARLERNAAQQGLDALDLAHEEARLIRRAARKLREKQKGGDTPLRLHHGGDATTTDAVGALLAACRAWPGPVWTYTHAWREVPREAWGEISVLASVETPAEIRLAVARRYAPALAVPVFPPDGKPWREAGIQFIPCPAELYAKETRQRRAEIAAGRAPEAAVRRPRTCFDCRLCFDADGLLKRGQGIGFEAHGSGKLIAVDALNRARRKAAPPLDSDEVRDSGQPPKSVDTASTDREVSE